MIDPAILLATAATVLAWFSPWLVHRRGDIVPWRSVFQAENARFWWAAMSIATFAGVFTVARASGPLAAAVCALAIDAAFLFLFHRRFATARDLERLCAGLSGGSDGATTLAALDVELSRLHDRFEARTNGYDAWAQWTLRIGARAAMAGHTAEALRWLDRVDSRRLRRSTRDLHAQYVASFRIRLGDRSGARALLARTQRPAERPETEQCLGALDSLISVLEGDPRVALAAADRALMDRLNAAARAIWLATRAHALEATGASQEARDVLRALRTEYGDTVIKNIAAHDGPASGHAAALLAEHGPYR